MTGRAYCRKRCVTFSVSYIPWSPSCSDYLLVVDKRSGGHSRDSRNGSEDRIKKAAPNNLYSRAPEQVDKFAPPPRPEIDIRQDFEEVVADAIAIGAQVAVYAIDPATARSPGMTLSGHEAIEATEASSCDTLNPLDSWGVCLSDVGRVVPPFDIARFPSREAARAWALSRELTLSGGGATLASTGGGREPTIKPGLKIKSAA